jgi:pimeloyl-ACP methyl ester carboxylesterase
MRELADGMCDKLFATETKLRQAQSVDRLRGVMLRSNPRAVAATLLGMAERADASTWLQEIAVPTLVVCGAEDAITGPTEMEALARAIPDAEYATIMNAGHLAPTERPEAFVSVLRGFLERVRRTAR